ncbi:hypothetical protein [Bacillus changyiensis]|uniref:hypothetical protein n=1 Tax=Bacillus changyiensis TaxID=3004103 RepID=UPI0022E907A3|nr:hypothetical protein [Bacillus changyiensis]MDA1477484.1 hypothetical protein [Bacillus changyiensis]
MIKKMGLLLVLTTGMLLSGAVGVSAETTHTSKAQSISPIKVHPQGMAHTRYEKRGDNYYFKILALQSPFNLNYYLRVAWTNDNKEPNSYNTITYVAATATGNSYDVVSNGVSTSVVEHYLTSGKDTVYGWAKAKNGKWYSAGALPFK